MLEQIDFRSWIGRNSLAAVADREYGRDAGGVKIIRSCMAFGAEAYQAANHILIRHQASRDRTNAVLNYASRAPPEPAGSSIWYLVRAFSACCSRASSINLSIKSRKGMPLASQSFGYMLMEVKPGMVFTSLR